MALLSAVVVATAMSLVLAADYKPDQILATFDGAEGTSFDWRDKNDPVMGGASTSTYKVENDAAIFNGTCAIVSFLNAPGFAKIETENVKDGAFPDISSALDGALELRVRSSTADYTGYKVAFRADDIPKTSIYGGGSFKAGFQLADTDEWQVVSVPFNTFSYDWSGYTGRCDTKDPNGQQHHCCTEDEPKYCPTEKYLSAFTGLGVWAEGVKGDFHIEIQWIGASAKK